MIISQNDSLTNFDNDILKSIISSQPYVFFQFVIDANRQFSVGYFNGDLESFCGVSVTQLEASPNAVFQEIVFEDDKFKFLSSISEKIKTQGEWEIEFRIDSKMGLRWCKIVANAIKNNEDTIFYGTATDITKQKSFEEEHRIAEMRSQFANLASGIGVWDWNMETNEVFYSNQSLKILEIDSNSDLISNPEKWDELVHPEDRELYFGNIQEHFDQKVPYYETYHRVLCNGRYKWILDRGKVIQRDQDGNPLRVIGTHTDVTAQKEKEQKLQATLDLVNSQKNRLLNFAHIVSHNLKNHTGNLSSLLQLQKEGIITIEETLENLQLVSNELNSTLEDLVELVNIQVNTNLEKEELSVKVYLEKVLTILKDTIESKSATIIHSISDDFQVKFTPAYLESVILNLTTNALKYIHPERKPIIEFYNEKDENFKEYDVLCVKDNGLGIDLNKYKDSIFGLYKTFHKNKDSAGIGLYITKNQIEAMAGKIEVDSKVNEGSVFKVYFRK